MARQFSSDDPVVHVEGESLVEDHELIFDDERSLPPPGPLASGDASADPTRVERPMRMVEARTRPRMNTLPLPLPLPVPPPLSPQPARVSSAQALVSSPQDGEIREGQVLGGKYYVVRALGRSGNGMVLLVRHIDLGQHLFFKYLPREVCVFPDTVARFMRGARAALQLTSEHAARTLDAGRLGSGIPYVVTEFLEGSDLRDVVRVRGALPITEAVDLVLQAAEAVADAHRHGVVHGNLNPSTLFVSQAADGLPLVKVMDFGVGDVLRTDPLNSPDSRRDARDLEDPGRSIEALSCAAPEQVRRAGDVDHRTDIWALGAILHEMLTGFPAYHADTLTGMLAMIVADPAPPLTSHRSDAPASLENVILRCFEKERSGRYASVAELAVALKQFASPESEALVDRIIRTLGRGAGARLAASGTPSSRAVVHIKSTPPPPPPVASPPPASAPPRSAPVPLAQRYQLVWSAALIAFGLFGGVVAGSLITRPVAPVAERVDVAGAHPAQVLQPANVVAAQPVVAQPAQPVAVQPVAVAAPGVAVAPAVAVATAALPAAVPAVPVVAPAPAAPAVLPAAVPAVAPQPAAPAAYPRARAQQRPREFARVEDDESAESSRARSKAMKTASAESSGATTLFDDVR